MEFLIKGSVLAIVVSVIGLLLRKNTPEFALLLMLSAALAIVCLAFGMFRELRSFFDELAETASLSGALLSPVLKCVGIAITSRLASDVCKDAGFSAAASAVELVAAAAALYAALPLMRTVLKMLGQLA